MSFVRVRKTVQPFVSSSGLSRFAQSSVNSFSNRPSKTLRVPVLMPPWPGSITMTRFVPKRQRRPAQKRFEIFLQIEPVQRNLAVNDLRREAEIDFNAVPGRFVAADSQNHHAVARTDRISRSPASRTAGAARRRGALPPSGSSEVQVDRRGAGFGIMTGGLLMETAELPAHRLGGLRRNPFHGGGIGPVQCRRNRRLRFANGFVGGGACCRLRRATGQKNQRANKNDSRKFEHAPIVRNGNADSSCFARFTICDGFTIYDFAQVENSCRHHRSQRRALRAAAARQS